MNLLRIGSGSGGDMPVALKALRIVGSLKADIQAFQNSGKKSLFLIETRPWLLWRNPNSSAK